MTLAELQEKRGRLVTQAREAMNGIKANTDESRAAELEQRHDTIMAEFDTVTAAIEREQRTAAAEAAVQELRGLRRPNNGEGQASGSDEPAGLSYRSAFAKYVCGGLEALNGEERSVLQRGFVRDEQAEQRAQTAGTTTAGGFTVPQELADVIIVAMKAHGPMYDGDIVTDVVTATGSSIGLPGVDDTSKSGSAHTEGADLTNDGSGDVVFTRKTLDAYTFDTPFIRWSWELDNDSILNMEQLLGGLIGERLGRLANTQLTTGTGSSAPNGIVTASGLGVTTALATALTADEILDLIHSVDPAYRKAPKTAFQFNDSTFKACRKLKDGQGNYLWQMGNVQQGQPDSFFGYNYHINQAMASIPTAASASKVMLFGDFGKYFVRKVGSPLIGVLRERFWPDMAIAGLIRIDGELGDTAAVKHLITKAS